MKQMSGVRRQVFGGGLLACLLAGVTFAAVDGTVANRTTGKPQPGATVTLYKLGQAGMESVESVKSDAAGKFVIDRPVSGPHLLQTAYDGVTYNHMLPPGRPSSGLTLDVYNASPQPGGAKITQHFLLFEPDGQQLTVTESFVFENSGNTTYNDPDGGTLRIYVPEAGLKSLEVNATAPQGMPIRRAAEKTGTPGVYKIDFPIKPGESNVHLGYSIPFTSPGAFEGRVLEKNVLTSLIAPQGVTLTGEGLEQREREPRTGAAIFQTRAASFKIALEGTGALQRGQPAAESGGGPPVEPIKPKIYSRLWWVLALGFGVLALGFALLYRASPEAAAKGRK